MSAAADRWAGLLGGEGEQRGRVGARGAARHHHRVPVRAVGRTVFAHPGEHLPGVGQVIGEARPGTQPVVHADAHPPPRGDPVEQGTRLTVLASAGVPAAVQVHQRGAAPGPGAVPVDVEQVASARVPVGDVRDPFDSAGPHRQRHEQGPQEVAPPGRGGAHGRAEPFGQGPVQDGPGAQAPPCQEHESHRGRGGQGDGRPGGG